MFQLLSLSIVLTLAVAPTAALLCEARCEPAVAASTGCHHEEVSGTSSAVQPYCCEDCGAQAAGVVLFVADDLRHSLSAPPTDLVILTRRYFLIGSTFDPRFGGEPRSQPSLKTHLLPYVLRI